MENASIGNMTTAIKIVSGGQTGADRAALDAALELGVQCGGWCPKGRKAEDGKIPERYPVIELVGGDYRDRTLKNVEDTDGTIIFYFDTMSGGTALTHRFCRSKHKPFLLIDGCVMSAEVAAARIAGFSRSLSGKTLNIAGPRASGNESTYDFVYEVICRFIRIYG